nr:MAG TPA: hypothetical protein [Caudoviricetes sp.]
MIGALVRMVEYVNDWGAYYEVSLEERDPVFDDSIIYGVNQDHFTLTVYSENGRVSKYWNARLLKDRTGYVRIACPREEKILHFNFFKWSAFFFCQSGMKELVMMPDSSRRAFTTLMREVK